MPGQVPPGFNGVITKSNSARAAATAAAKARKAALIAPPANPKGHTNPLVSSAGGRVQPKVTKSTKARGGNSASANAAAAAGNGSTNVDPTPSPVDPNPVSGNPEDQALASLQQNPGYGPVGSGGTNLAGQFDPMKYAQGMAGKQYDPAIVSMATRIKGIINALPGALDSLHAAFGNLDRAAANPAQVNVVGGSTGAQAAYQGQVAAIDNTSAASQAASAASREADWAQRMKLISSANVNDLRGQLGGLNQQKADATAGYYQQGLKTKSDLVAQAIANINSIRAGNDAEAMVKGGLIHQGLQNDALQLGLQGQALQQSYLPGQLEQGMISGNLQNQGATVSLASAKATLKQQLTGSDQRSLSAAYKAGPAAINALTSFIIPPGTGVVQDPTTGNITVKGDPNNWAKTGVAQIMKFLPQSKRANVVRFVNQQIQAAIGSAHGSSGATWTQDKSGKWHRPK